MFDRHTAVDVASGSNEQEKEVHQNGQQSCTLKTNHNVYKENAPVDRLQVSRSGLQHARSADGGSPRRPARESRRVSLAQAADYVQLNQYKLLEPIGQGSYGIVKLAYNEEDETHYAMKILSKRKLLRRAGVFGRAPPRRPSSGGPTADPLHRIYREIAVLKKLDHPNVVKLVEVLDDPAEDQLYLVFQLLEGGPVIEVPTTQPLTEDVARSYFRDALLGIEYLHYQRIVHRDIKPENLLLGEGGRVQVADLGVCDELSAGDDRCGVAGTPAFRAPEATHPAHHIDGKAADVWSLGVTLYCLVCGDVPFWGASVTELNARIRRAEPTLPRRLSAPLRHLLQAMLHKDPTLRATLSQIKEHPWVTRNGTDLLPSEEENCRLVEITDEDVAQVVTSIPNLSTLILIKTMLKKHSFQNPFSRNRNSSGSSRASTEEGTASTGKRPVLSRSGRSVSAPGSYLTERQASFDIPLPALNESTDQTPTEAAQIGHLGCKDCKALSGSVILESVDKSRQVIAGSGHTVVDKTRECSDR